MFFHVNHGDQEYYDICFMMLFESNINLNLKTIKKIHSFHEYTYEGHKNSATPYPPSMYKFFPLSQLTHKLSSFISSSLFIFSSFQSIIINGLFWWSFSSGFHQTPPPRRFRSFCFDFSGISFWIWSIGFWLLQLWEMLVILVSPGSF